MDVDEACAELIEQFGDMQALVPVSRSGAWSNAFFFTASVYGRRRDLVARFGPHDSDFAKDEWAASWASPALPVPRVQSHWSTGSQYAIVTDRHNGTFLEDLDADGWVRVLPHLWGAIEALRAIPVIAVDRPPQVSAADIGADRPWAQRLCDFSDDPNARTGGWSQTLAQSPTTDASLHAAVEMLGKLTNKLNPRQSYVHSDLIHANVLAEPDGSGLNALLDWGCLHLNDYLYDLAWLDFWSPWHPGLDAVNIRERATKQFRPHDPDPTHFEDRWRACAIHIGASHLAYNAFIGDVEQIAACDRRLADFDARADQ